MSYSFDGGGTNIMSRTASVPVITTPCTFSAWIKTNTVALAKWVCGVDNSGTANDYFRLGTGSAASAQAQHRTIANGNFTAGSTPTALVTGTWIPIVAVFASGTSRAAYAYGANQGTDANTVGAFNSVPNELRLGLRVGGSPEAWDGLLAHVAIWNVALSSTDAANLALYPPTFVQPGNLLAYYPLTDNQGTSAYNDAVGSYNLTITGATYSSDNPAFPSTVPQLGRNIFIMP